MKSLDHVSRELSLRKTLEQLEKLPNNKLEEASDFVEFLANRIEDNLLVDGIKQLASRSTSFSLLEEEEVQYKISDLEREI